MIIKSPVCYDTSHWKLIPDFALVSPRPVLVITKATQHTSYVDPTFADYFTDMRQDGIARGAFHFFSKSHDPLKQAQHFVSTVAQYATTDDILVLDFEEGGETAAQIITFLQFVNSRFPLNIIMVYSRKDLMNAIPMTPAQRDILTGYPVWVAGYPNNPDPYFTVPAGYIPDQTKWGPVWLWQYSSSGVVEGISGDVDCNWVHPTLAKIISGFEPSEPPPGETMTYRYEATNIYADMALRPDHDTNNTATARYPVSTKFHGDFVFVVEIDTYEMINNVSTLINKRGDKWLEVVDVNGVAKAGWVALVHFGRLYCNLVDSGPVTPPAEFRWPDRFSAEYLDAAGNVVANRFYVPE